jgi:hypothetical protein
MTHQVTEKGVVSSDKSNGSGHTGECFALSGQKMIIASR